MVLSFFFLTFFHQKMRNKNKRGRVEEKRLLKWLNHLLATFSEYFLRFSPTSIHVSQIWLHWETFVFSLLVVDLKVLLIFFFLFFFPGTAPKFNIFFKCHNILNCKNSFFLLPYFSTPKAPSRYIYFCKPAFVFLYIYLWDFPINFLNFQEIKNKNSPLNRL